jgi:hypothetical protein
LLIELIVQTALAVVGTILLSFTENHELVFFMIALAAIIGIGYYALNKILSGKARFANAKQEH